MRSTISGHREGGAGHGRVRLETDGEQRWELGQADHLPIPPTRHRVESLEDSVILLSVAAVESVG
jgi:hypothetical protein